MLSTASMVDVGEKLKLMKAVSSACLRLDDMS
jgi:hypothetical protein